MVPTNLEAVVSEIADDALATTLLRGSTGTDALGTAMHIFDADPRWVLLFYELERESALQERPEYHPWEYMDLAERHIAGILGVEAELP